MKKFLLLFLIFALSLSVIPVSAADTAQVEINGEIITCTDVKGNIVSPMLIDGTTYLPVRAIVTSLGLDIVWDDATKSVFIEGTPEKAEKTDVVNIFIKGEKFTATTITGKVVNPILKDGTTYLPIRAIGEAFGLLVSWDDARKTAVLTSPTKVLVIEEGKEYAFVNKASGKAISLTDSALSMQPFNYYNFQGFKLTKADTDGYYYITASNDKNFDVNGNSKNPGATIITYNPGTADNQKFRLDETEDGYLIYALSSLLPIEDSAGMVKQNEKRDSLVQKWDIVQMVISREKNDVFYRIGTAYGAIYDKAEGLRLAYINDCNDDMWNLVPNKDGEYIITNVNSGKSLDVANNSKTSGDPIITYKTSGDANQRWTFEKQEDGTYLIKSVHSGLYLSVASDNSIIHAELNESLKQNWTVSVY